MIGSQRLKESRPSNALPLVVALLLGALPAASVAGPSAEQPAAKPNPAPASCPNSGERPLKRGLLGNVSCIKVYRDAGKACSGKKDCAGRCVVTQMPRGVPPMVGVKAPGVCEAESPAFGCMAEVERGRLKTPMICTS